MSLIMKFLSILLLAFSLTVHAERVELAKDFSADKKLAQEQDKAILLMFSATDCPYCAVMEEDFLDPMLINPEDTGAIIRKVEIDMPEEIVNFNGSKTSVKDLTDSYRIRVTPTLLFLDTDGREKAGRIVGVMTRDYLGYFIDKNIELVKRRMAANQSRRIIKHKSEPIDTKDQGVIAAKEEQDPEDNNLLRD